MVVGVVVSFCWGVGMGMIMSGAGGFRWGAGTGSVYVSQHDWPSHTLHSYGVRKPKFLPRRTHIYLDNKGTRPTSVCLNNDNTGLRYQGCKELGEKGQVYSKSQTFGTLLCLFAPEAAPSLHASPKRSEHNGGQFRTCTLMKCFVVDCGTKKRCLVNWWVIWIELYRIERRIRDASYHISEIFAYVFIRIIKNGIWNETYMFVWDKHNFNTNTLK